MKKKFIVLDDVDIQSVIMCVGWGGRRRSDWWQLLSGSQLAEQLSLPPTCLEFSPPPPFFWVCVCVLVTRSYKGLWVSVCGPALSQVCTRGWEFVLASRIAQHMGEPEKLLEKFYAKLFWPGKPKKKNVRDFSVSGLLCGGRLRRVCFHARGVRLGRSLLRLGGQGPEELRGLSDGRTEADGRARLPVTDGQLYVCHHGALQPGWGKENPWCVWKKCTEEGESRVNSSGNTFKWANKEQIH